MAESRPPLPAAASVDVAMTMTAMVPVTTPVTAKSSLGVGRHESQGEQDQGDLRQ